MLRTALHVLLELQLRVTRELRTENEDVHKGTGSPFIHFLLRRDTPCRSSTPWTINAGVTGQPKGRAI